MLDPVQFWPLWLEMFIFSNTYCLELKQTAGSCPVLTIGVGDVQQYLLFKLKQTAGSCPVLTASGSIGWGKLIKPKSWSYKRYKKTMLSLWKCRVAYCTPTPTLLILLLPTYTPTLKNEIFTTSNNCNVLSLLQYRYFLSLLLFKVCYFWVLKKMLVQSRTKNGYG